MEKSQAGSEKRIVEVNDIDSLSGLEERSGCCCFYTRKDEIDPPFLIFILVDFYIKKQKKQRQQRMKPRRKQPRFIINDEIENTKRCDIYNTNK